MAKSIISFGLWGTDNRYTIGAIRNSELAPRIYPGWVCRFYCDTDVPPEIVEQLKANGCEIAPFAPGIPKLFQRFLVADDPDVERFLSRDSDSRLNNREAIACEEWIAEDKCGWVCRDHPAHARAVNGGLMGAMWRRNDGWQAPSMMGLIEQWLKEHPEDTDGYGKDQDFLGEMVWPWLRSSCTQHDSVCRDAYFGAKPFPTKREHPRFVGEVFLIGENGEDVPRDGDWEQIQEGKE